MQVTNSATIVDYFPEAFIAEACEKKGVKKLNFSLLKTLINKEINDEKIYNDLNYKFEFPNL